MIDSTTSMGSEYTAGRSSAHDDENPGGDAPKILIYSAERCQWCVAAKRLLKSEAWEYEEVVVDLSPEGRDIVTQATGGSSLPQLIFDGAAVGEYRELVELIRSR